MYRRPRTSAICTNVKLISQNNDPPAARRQTATPTPASVPQASGQDLPFSLALSSADDPCKDLAKELNEPVSTADLAILYEVDLGDKQKKQNKKKTPPRSDLQKENYQFWAEQRLTYSRLAIKSSALAMSPMY